ncbi:pentapeptide repeat-containing protein [Secundilactobacillus kimchicus]|uniref:pentapeptide repeat-containing protein n=1 Tax=Secundilactobacillus kimchicus TaxID=528209 RepID=UPI001C0094F5
MNTKKLPSNQSLEEIGMNQIKGYKVFNQDWTCRGKQYEVGKMYHESGEIKACHHGMHFCPELVNCFNYYSFNPLNKVAEVVGWGQSSTVDEDKIAVSDLRIIRELTWEEVLSLVNSGRGNSGNRNSGNRNSGNHNSGDYNSRNCNSGNSNSGDYNSGNSNSGDFNSGDRNSGDFNSGDFNSGDFNSGHYNSGDFNTVDHSADFLSTKSRKLRLFNKKVDLTREELVSRLSASGLYSMPKPVDDNGKEIDKATLISQRQQWWDNKADQNAIKALPNFNPEVFKECTGITVDVMEEFGNEN